MDMEWGRARSPQGQTEIQEDAWNLPESLTTSDLNGANDLSKGMCLHRGATYTPSPGFREAKQGLLGAVETEHLFLPCANNVS